MQNRSNLFIDSLCYLVADIGNGEDAIKNFLINHVELETDKGKREEREEALKNLVKKLNERGEKGLRVVESAAISGSVSSLHYLIEVCKVDISADEDTPNLVERALNNPAARDYLLNPETLLWQRFNDGTNEFLAHVMAGRFSQAQTILEANPQQICDKNLRFQNALHWSHLTKQNLEWFKTCAESFLLQNSQPAHWANMARHCACMGHYKRLQFPNRPNVAFMQFDLSVQYFKRALATRSHPQESYQLKIDLAEALLFSGRMHLLMKVGNSDAAAHSIAMSDACLNEAIKLMRTLPKDLLNSHNHLLDTLLREHAENCFMLDDICYAIGDSLAHELKDAVEFYKKCLSYGEEAVRSADEIGKKTDKDNAAMIKYCDKLYMSYGALVTCHHSIAQRNGPNEKFHHDEHERYDKMATAFLSRDKAEPPSKFVPPRVTPKALIQPITTNGHTNGHTNGTLKSPDKVGIFKLNVSPRCSPLRGTLKAGDDLSALFLPPTFSALTT
jgi:hypothetical protein